MSQFNYAKTKKKAQKVIRNAGAAFIVERNGRKKRGYMVMDGVEKGWRDDHLTETETATCICDIEVLQGDVLRFAKLKTEYRVLDSSPEQPNGEPLFWNVSISR